MKLSATLGVAAVLVAALSACQEKLTTPVECPELCPGTSLTVRDTVLNVNLGTDSTFTGYVSATEMQALLVSSGIDAGEARAYWTFPRRSDSVFVDGLQYLLAVDSVAVAMPVLARDTLTTGVKLYLYRVVADLDTTVALAALDAQLTTESLIDSVAVLDTVRSGTVRLVLAGDKIARLVGAEADTGRVGIAVRVGAGVPTGIRLGSLTSSLGGPSIISYGRVALTDTAKVRQRATYFAEKANYVFEPPPVPAGRIWLGGKSGARVIMRFTLPAYLRDSASILRATLELTPAIPLRGLRSDSPSLEIRGVLTDLGAKSPALAGVTASTQLPVGVTSVLQADVRSIVSTWFGGVNTPPNALLMAIIPEGASFSRPEFFSSGTGSGSPRLRVTYALPSRPGHP